MKKGVKKKETNEITLGLVAGWFFGIIFLLTGFVSFISLGFGVGICYLLIGLILLPPSIRKIEEKGNFHLKTGVKVLLVIILLILPMFLLPSSLDSYESSTPTTTQRDNNPFSDAPEREVDYKSFSYDTAMRYPDNNLYQYFKVRGRIFDTQKQSDGSYVYLIFTGKIGDTYLDDTVYVTYSGGQRFIDDDVITIYGKYMGLGEYTTVLRANTEVPLIISQRIERYA